MSEVKPVIKTEAQRISDRYSEKTIKYLADHVFLKESRAEAEELRAALEASQEKLERLNGLYHSEVSKHQLDYNALQAENARLTKCLIAANSDTEKFERQYYLELNKVEDLQAENAEQAKRIAELEQQLHDRTVTSGAKIHDQARCIAELIAWIEILRDSFPIELFPTMKTELEVFLATQKGAEV